MTAVGKILVFLNLVFSVLTAGMITMIFVTRTNWKLEYERVRNVATVADTAYKTEKTQREEDGKKLREKIDELSRDVVAKQASIVAVEKDLATTREERDRVTSAAKSSDTNSVVAREELDRIKKERDALVVEKQQRLSEIAKLLKDLNDQRQLAVANEIAYKSKQAQAERLLDQNEAIVQKIKQLEFQLNANTTTSPSTTTVSNPSLTGGPPVPGNVRGTVTAFLDSSNLATISIGSDAGIQPNAQLHVYRLAENAQDSKYLGTLVIRQVTPKQAVGLFKAATKDVPRAGDEVGVLNR